MSRRAAGGVAQPYYDEGGITVFHSRCEDVLPTLDAGSVDLVLTDPPYGMGLDTAYDFSVFSHSWPKVHGDDAPFDPTHLLRFKRLVLWGANHYASRLPDSGGWIVWNKRGDGLPSTNNFGDCELAWTNLSSSVRLFSYMWHGVARWTKEPTLHPTQKPVALMTWILERYTRPGDLILDPYMGSGPVARACKNTGRRYIGIEIVESYCQAAVARLQQEVFAFEVAP